MYTVHATKKLLDRLKEPLTPPVTEPTTVLGNWYATALFWKPQVAMFVNERTFLPVFVALAPASTLLDRFPAALTDVLRVFGVDPRFVAAELAAMAEPSVSKTADRHVLGVMNELALNAEIRVENRIDASDLPGLSVSVAGVLVSPLYKKRDGAGSPDRALRALINDHMP